MSARSLPVAGGRVNKKWWAKLRDLRKSWGQVIGLESMEVDRVAKNC